MAPWARTRERGEGFTGPDLSLFHQHTREIWRLTSLETHQVTSRRCLLFCFRYVHLSSLCGWWVLVPSRPDPVCVPQGTREEDDVVSEDLVEQDAKVRLGRSLGQVASRQGWGWGIGTTQT